MQEKIQNNSPIKQRILHFIDTLGISKRDFYDKTGISRGTLESDTGITEGIMAKFIATYPTVSISWLITGAGEMYLDKMTIDNNNAEINTYKLKSDTNLVEERIPVYNIKAAAGVVAIFDNLQKQTPTAYLQIPNLPKCDGAIHIVGDSMYPLLKSGDIVAYKIVNNLDNLFWGEMYLLSLVNDGDSFITVKYLQKSDREGFIRLVSQNQHHQEVELPFESIKFAALIKASIRINSMG